VDISGELHMIICSIHIFLFLSFTEFAVFVPLSLAYRFVVSRKLLKFTMTIINLVHGNFFTLKIVTYP
jgi:hypothetical protein